MIVFVLAIIYSAAFPSICRYKNCIYRGRAAVSGTRATRSIPASIINTSLLILIIYFTRDIDFISPISVTTRRRSKRNKTIQSLRIIGSIIRGHHTLCCKGRFLTPAQLETMDSLKLVSRMGQRGTRSIENTKLLANKELSPHKKKAQSILKRQELIAQKSRLESLLTHQFIGKYGSKNPQSKLNVLITSVVKEYVQENDSIQADKLVALEAKLSSLTQKIKDSVITEKAVRSREARSSEEADSSHANSGKGKVTLPDIKGSIDPKQWSVLNAAMAVYDEEVEQKKQDALRQKKLAFKADLEKQKYAVDQRKSHEKDENLVYAAYNRAYVNTLTLINNTLV